MRQGRPESGTRIGTRGVPRFVPGFLLSAFALAIAAEPAEPPEARKHPAEEDPYSAPVDVDAEITAWLESAKALAEKGNWARVLENLQRIVEQGRSPLEKVKADGAGILYRPVRDLCHRQIADLPKEARDLYRATHDPSAKLAWEESLKTGDEMPLRRIVRNYLGSSFGDLACDRLAALALDRGDPRGALFWLQRIESLYPALDLHVDPGVLKARKTLALLLAGEKAKAERIHGETAAQAALPGGDRHVLRIGEDEVPLERLLARWMGEVGPLPSAAARADGWPLPGGSSSRALPMPEGSWRLGRRVLNRGGVEGEFQIPRANDSLGTSRVLFGIRVSNAGAGRVLPRQMQIHNQQVYINQGFVPVPQISLPCVTPEMEVAVTKGWGTMQRREVERDRLVVVQWPNQKAVAYRFGNGKQHWVGPAGDDGARSGPIPRFQPAGRPAGAFAAGPQAVVSDRWVYLVRTEPGVLDRTGGQDLVNRLFALDLQTGKQVWIAGAEAAPRGTGAGGEEGGDRSFLSKCFFLGTPVPAEGRLYVAAYHPEGFHLVCLSEGDAKSGGRLLWATRVSAGGFEAAPLAFPPGMGVVPGPSIAPDAAVAVDAGLAVVATGRGVIAAVDAAMGDIRWVRKYATTATTGTPGAVVPAIPQPFLRRRRIPTAGPEPAGWDETGLLLTPELVVAVPADADQAFAFRREDGERQWMVTPDDRRDPRFWGNVRYLAGTTRGLLVFGGRQTMVAHAATGRLVYRWPEADRDGTGPDAAAPRGRVAVGDRSIVVPSSLGLVSIDADRIAREVVQGRAGIERLGAYKPEIVKPGNWDDGRVWAPILFGGKILLFGDQEAYAFASAPERPAGGGAP